MRKPVGIMKNLKNLIRNQAVQMEAEKFEDGLIEKWKASIQASESLTGKAKVEKQSKILRCMMQEAGLPKLKYFWQVWRTISRKASEKSP
jgi:hypothetical protein